jgi:AraC family transcriptional regulator of arabinose operon
MPPRLITPNPPAGPIFGDEFVQGANYANWRPRGSGDHLLIYTVAGAGLVAPPGEPVKTRPGDLLLYEPEALHDYRTAPGRAMQWRLLWTHFHPRPSWHRWLQWPEIAPRIRLVHLPAFRRAACAEALRRMVRASHRPGPVYAELAMAALEEAILYGWATRAGDRSPVDPRIERAVETLTDGFRQPFRLPALARQCGLSVSRFSHLFRAATGVTPGQFHERQRLAHAAHLLRLTAMTVGEAAAECGFADPFYFTHRFRRRYGVSPTGFRARAAGEGGRNRLSGAAVPSTSRA